MAVLSLVLVVASPPARSDEVPPPEDDQWQLDVSHVVEVVAESEENPAGLPGVRSIGIQTEEEEQCQGLNDSRRTGSGYPYNCTKYTVNCEGLAEIEVWAALRHAPLANQAETRGMLVGFAGGFGTGWWGFLGDGDPQTDAAELINALNVEGYQIAFVRWVTTWMENPDLFDPDVGYNQVLCRPAEMIHFLFQTKYRGPDQGDTAGGSVQGVCGFCVTGHSGRVRQIGYGLSKWSDGQVLAPLDGMIDGAFPVSGPAHGLLKFGACATRSMTSTASSEKATRPWRKPLWTWPGRTWISPSAPTSTSAWTGLMTLLATCREQDGRPDGRTTACRPASSPVATRQTSIIPTPGCTSRSASKTSPRPSLTVSASSTPSNPTSTSHPRLATASTVWNIRPVRTCTRGCYAVRWTDAAPDLGEPALTLHDTTGGTRRAQTTV